MHTPKALKTGLSFIANTVSVRAVTMIDRDNNCGYPSSAWYTHSIKKSVKFFAISIISPSEHSNFKEPEGKSNSITSLLFVLT